MAVVRGSLFFVRVVFPSCVSVEAGVSFARVVLPFFGRVSVLRLCFGCSGCVSVEAHIHESRFLYFSS